MDLLLPITAKLTLEGHFTYVWSAWLLALLIMAALLISSLLTRRKVVRQLELAALIEQRPQPSSSQTHDPSK